MQGIGHMGNGRAEKSSSHPAEKGSPEINDIKELLPPRRRERGRRWCYWGSGHPEGARTMVGVPTGSWKHGWDPAVVRDPGKKYPGIFLLALPSLTH